MSSNYDTIIIGAGHNGLVAASYLAKAGQKVLVLEKRSALGGAAGTEEAFPGFKMNVGAEHAHLFRPEIIEDLGLKAQGLKMKESSVVAHSLNPDGAPLTIHTDVAKTQKNIAAFSQKDSERYAEFCEYFPKMALMLREINLRKPIDPTDFNAKDLMTWFPVARKLRKMGKKDMPEFLRVLPMCVYDFMNEWFENDFVKGTLSSKSSTGIQQGPRAQGTTFMLLYQNGSLNSSGLTPPSIIEGGMGALSEALAKKAKSLGVTIQTDTGVSGITVENGKATGVTSDNGEKFSAKRVVSNADPYQTFMDMVGPEELGLKFVRDTRNIKFKGTTAKLNLALKSLPQFGGDGATSQDLLTGNIIINPSMNYLERAYDDSKYGKFSQNPCLSMTIPSLLDPTLAPSGQHVMSVTMQFAPFHLRESNWKEQSAILAEHILNTIKPHCPNIGDLILHQDMITPLDLQNKLSLPEGSIYHGQMGLDQVMFMRPIAGFGGYKTPIDNLYLCGAGAHPGGGVTGAPGHNAAKAVLAD